MPKDDFDSFLRSKLSWCLSVLDLWNVNLGVNYKLEKNRFRIKLDFFFKFELDFYCLCSLQKSISKSNWFFNFLNLIFRNWKKIEWHSIFQKSSENRQGVSYWKENVLLLFLSKNWRVMWSPTTPLVPTSLNYEPTPLFSSSFARDLFGDKKLDMSHAAVLHYGSSNT